jgi:phosphoribosylformylglycinamidine (FGAM) synthase-like enzyme
MKNPEMILEIISDYGLKPEEYFKIVQLIGREPNVNELAMFSSSSMRLI